jgi:hypothetical protein
VRRFNAVLKSEGRPYLLIGPGRWGSFDPWLGIPVKWEEINGAGAIVELRNSDLKVDPSKGSHFFQHITTHGIPYLTISDEGEEFIRWKKLQNIQPVEETDYLCHVHLSSPLLIKCNGRISQSIVRLPRS